MVEAVHVSASSEKRVYIRVANEDEFLSLEEVHDLIKRLQAARADAVAKDRQAKQDRRNAIFAQISELQDEMKKLDEELNPAPTAEQVKAFRKAQFAKPLDVNW